MDWVPRTARGTNLFMGTAFALCGLVLVALAVTDAAHGAVRPALLHSFWGLTLLAAALMPGILRRDVREVLADRAAIPRPAALLQLGALACLVGWAALALLGWEQPAAF